MSTREPVYKIEHQRLSEQVYFYIKRLILSGELQGGEKIPEAKIAERFGVSRTPIREALRRLEAYGLIAIKPHSYASVVKLDAAEVAQIFCVRNQLERMSVSLLAAHGSDEDFHILQELSDVCCGYIEQRDVASTLEKDSQFHLEIAKRTGNRYLYELIERIDAKVQLSRLMIHLPVDELAIYIKQHEDIIRLMQQRDIAAIKAFITQHILRQLKHYGMEDREFDYTS